MNTARAERMKWNLAWVLLIALSLGLLLPGYFYLLPRKFEQLTIADSVKVTVFAPQYVSALEEQDITVAIQNKTATSADVVLEFISEGPSVNFLTSPDSNRLYAGQIQSGEKINRQLRLFFAERSGSEARLALSGTVKTKAGDTVNTNVGKLALPINIAPIPKTGSITYFLSAAWAALALWIAKEWWERTKRTQQNAQPPEHKEPEAERA